MEVCATAAGELVSERWSRIRGVNIDHALVGLAAANTVEIKKDMKRLRILNLMPVRRYERGTSPKEFTSELGKMAEAPSDNLNYAKSENYWQ